MSTLGGLISADDASVREAIDGLRARVPDADPLRYLPDVHPARIPRHIAMIMDGNGRWAQDKGFDRTFGHRNGARVAKDMVEWCSDLGVEVLTLYSFSMENWRRPPEEIAALMHLCELYIDGERERMKREGVRFRVIGRRDGLPDEVRAAIERSEAATRDVKGITLVLALNYSSRDEITRAAAGIVCDVLGGKLEIGAIDEACISARLDTAGLPDPDLVVRTAGEMRVSNYLLWQISYAELFVTDVLWPDFSREDLHRAVREFAGRDRTFGGLGAGGRGGGTGTRTDD